MKYNKFYKRLRKRFGKFVLQNLPKTPRKRNVKCYNDKDLLSKEDQECIKNGECFHEKYMLIAPADSMTENLFSTNEAFPIREHSQVIERFPISAECSYCGQVLMIHNSEKEFYEKLFERQNKKELNND